MDKKFKYNDVVTLVLGYWQTEADYCDNLDMRCDTANLSEALDMVDRLFEEFVLDDDRYDLDAGFNLAHPGNLDVELSRAELLKYLPYGMGNSVIDCIYEDLEIDEKLSGIHN